MNPTIRFLLLLLFSCSGMTVSMAQGISTPPEKEPLRIAVVPCEIVKIKQPWSDFSAAEQARIETSLSLSLQAEVYDYLLDHVQAHRSQTVALQAYSDTNDLLYVNGIHPQKAWQLPTAELARLLKVDAVLRVSIQENSGSATQHDISADLFGREICDDGLFINGDKTLVSAGLFDGWTGLPLWSIGHPEPVSRGRNRKTIARRIVRDLKGSLP